MLDPIPSKLLKEVLPEVIDPLLTIINSSLSLGYALKTFKLLLSLLLRSGEHLASFWDFSKLPENCSC